MVLMTWKTPAYKEISVKCEINSYASAELGQGSAQADLSGNIGNNFEEHLLRSQNVLTPVSDSRGTVIPLAVS
jgi:coenzyme PQQ precursor peptide PqqA